MITRTSAPAIALAHSASKTERVGTKYGVSIQTLSLASRVMPRNWNATGFLSLSTGLPGTSCIGIAPGCRGTSGNRAGSAEMSSPVQYSQSSSNILCISFAWLPEILTAASLQYPRGPSSTYSLPTLKPPM